MSTPNETGARAAAAADTVVEYALIAFQEQFLCWEKNLNVEVAEFVWNAGGRGLESCEFVAPGPQLGALVRTLARARRSRWGDEEFLLLNLDVRTRKDDLVFTFELSFNEGETFQAFEIEAGMHLAGKEGLN